MNYRENLLINYCEGGALLFNQLQLDIQCGASDPEIVERLDKIAGSISEMKIYLDNFEGEK